MKFIPQEIPDIILIEPNLFGDQRGYFYESYREDLFNKAVGYNVNFVQDNESKSGKGVIRGLHYQVPPFAQSKLVRVIKGLVLDVVVDIRKSSKSFGKSLSFEISSQNKHQLFVPRGFAHGFVVLSESAIFSYKVDNYYSPKHERGIAYDDKDLAIDWKLSKELLKLSDKDKSNPPLAEIKNLFWLTMRILVTGSNGQLGKSIKRIVNEKNYKKRHNFGYVFPTRAELDLFKSDSIKNYFDKNKIDLIINCAAYTMVDQAESNEEQADQLNHLAVKEIAQIAKKKDIILIHISTDFVFDGYKHSPYLETDTTSPLNIYGRTKLDGEKAILLEMKFDAIIIRTSWLYSEFGNNFVDTILNIAQKKSQLNIVNDQIGSPTYASDLAHVILQIVDSYKFNLKEKKSQLYHYSNSGECSWYDFAKEIIINFDIDCLINPISSYDYPLPAKRPKYSSLDTNKIKQDFDLSISDWRNSLRACLKRIKA